jgi:hypothetical protein
MSKKGPENVSMDVDPLLLSKEEREALAKEAAKAVNEDRKQAASDAYYQEELKRQRRRHTPSEQYVRIIIDAAPYVKSFMLDGEVFYTGYEYRVRRSVATVLNEQMQRSFQHQDEIDGRSKFAPYRRAQGMFIARDGAVHSGVEKEIAA